MKNEAGDNVRILVAFGDITGFSSYCDAIASNERELAPFLDALDRILEEELPDYSLADTGDGFMLVMDLDAGHNCRQAVEVLVALWRVLVRIRKLIRSMPHPRPIGFRIRVTVGYAIRKVRSSGSLSFRGKCVNLAHNLLEVRKTLGIILHITAKSLLSTRQLHRAGFTLRPIQPGRAPDCIPRRDAERLYALEPLKERRSKS
jgi:hypothetical protein